jgi:hypothetical protein
MFAASRVHLGNHCCLIAAEEPEIMLNGVCEGLVKDMDLDDATISE